jgi:hypothetical protein
MRTIYLWSENQKGREVDLREIGQEDVNWIYLAQNRDLRQAVVNSVMNLWIP